MDIISEKKNESGARRYLSILSRDSWLPYYLMVGSNVDKKTFHQRFITQSPVNWTIWNACTIMTMAIEEKFINWMANDEQKFHGQIWLE